MQKSWFSQDAGHFNSCQVHLFMAAILGTILKSSAVMTVYDGVYTCLSKFLTSFSHCFDIPFIVSVFKALVSMAIYGMDYFPLFASLALESAVGYCVGTAYAWLLFIVQVFQIFECPMDAVSRWKKCRSLTLKAQRTQTQNYVSKISKKAKYIVKIKANTVYPDEPSDVGQQCLRIQLLLLWRFKG